MGMQPKCDCSFSTRWLLPCAHVLRVAHLIDYGLNRLIPSRWILKPSVEKVSEVPSSSVRVQEVSTSYLKASKLAEVDDVLKDVGVKLCNLRVERYRFQLEQLRLFGDMFSEFPDVHQLFQRNGGRRGRLTEGQSYFVKLVRGH